MAKIDVKNINGENVSTLDLAESIFCIDVNEPAMHMAVVNYLANQRQGTQSAKTRAEVKGGGAKPWRQKGTGRARQGSTRSPQWTHGGIAFAPKPREYRFAMNKKLRRLALKSAFSAKFGNEDLIVIDKIELDSFKTKAVADMLLKLDVKNALIVTEDVNLFLVKSAANIQNIKTALTNTLNTYDILKYEKLILTEGAVKIIEEVYA